MKSDENLNIRRSIAEELLGCRLDEDGFAPCPGRHLHGSAEGRRDFRVILEGVPTGTCFHASCAGALEEFNWTLRSRIGKAEANRASARHGSIMGPVPPAPEAPKRPKRPPYDPRKLADFASRCPHKVDENWLIARSPISIPEKQDASTAELFLRSIYLPGDRVLIFSREFSQGDWIWTPEAGCFRLSDRPGVKGVPSPLPLGGPLGIWYLANPVTGKWELNPNNRDERGSARLGRRHGACCTSWRFMVIESDEAPAADWLRALVMLPLPLVGIYTSGGRSYHALARVDASNKQEWDMLRDDLVPILAPLGADPAAMTAVRLTRLPGAMRHGSRAKDGKTVPYASPRLQRLLYLNPSAKAVPILDLR